MADPVHQACQELVESLDLDGVTLDGRYEPESRALRVQGLAPEGPEIHERLLEIALDLFFLLPDGVGPGCRYEFELQTLAEAQPAHRYRFCTGVDAMLDTGEVTREQWDLFRSQVEYTLDGVPLPYPEPDEFFEG